MTLWDKLARFGTTYTEALPLISPFFSMLCTPVFHCVQVGEFEGTCEVNVSSKAFFLQEAVALPGWLAG